MGQGCFWLKNSLKDFCKGFYFFWDFSPYLPQKKFFLVNWFYFKIPVYIFIFRKFDSNSIIFSYAFGIIITLLAYFDSWDHHLLNLIPILIIIIFNLSRHSEITIKIKYSLFFFSFLSLIFAGIWFQIYHLFPYNFLTTIFLLLTFYEISKYCLFSYQKGILEV